jgi:hypothetical protein
MAKVSKVCELGLPTIGRAIYVRFNKDSVETLMTYEVDQHLHENCMDI